MPCLGSARLVFNSLKVPISRHSLYSFFTSSISTTTRLIPRRVFSTNSHDDLFNYTSGRWVFNDALRHAERRVVFDVEGLRRLAAQSVGRSPDDVVKLSKLADGRLNRTFLITMRDNFQIIARIPYPVTVPKYYAVASEVATMEFLRASGLPVPQVYGYSPVSDNPAKTEYIFMEFIKGTKMSDVWSKLGILDIISILRQIVQLESKMMSISFPAGGSLYYTHDLEKVAKKAAIPLKDKNFCVGPDTRWSMWHGRRSQLDVDRGPYKSAKSALVAAAHKELAYLKKFGQPLLPFHRQRRDGYQYQKQLPSAHIENLERYLLIASSLVPMDPALNRFCIRHPELREGSIFIQKSSDSGWQIVGLIDWKNASILPQFLHAGVPLDFQNLDNSVSQPMTLPWLPENFDELDENEKYVAEKLHRSNSVHYHYIQNTEAWNMPHHYALMDPMCVLCSSLFDHASDPWLGETIDLKVALIRAVNMWETLIGKGTPCPIAFDAGDAQETMVLNKVLERADNAYFSRRVMLGIGPGDCVPTRHYEEVVAHCSKAKAVVLSRASSKQEYANIMAHWPWDDMDEGKYE